MIVLDTNVVVAHLKGDALVTARLASQVEDIAIPALVVAELAEFGEECARVLLLLQRLAKARALRHDCSDILGELSAIVLHLHAHTQGLDEVIDDLKPD